jgi:hypothetical protein
VSAAGKGPRRINPAALIAWIQERAPPVGIRRFFENLATGRSPSAGSQKRFPSGDVRNLTGQLESTTIGSRHAGALDRPICELLVDRFHFPKQRGFVNDGKRLVSSHQFLVPK